MRLGQRECGIDLAADIHPIAQLVCHGFDEQLLLLDSDTVTDDKAGRGLIRRMKEDWTKALVLFLEGPDHGVTGADLRPACTVDVERQTGECLALRLRGERVRAKHIAGDEPIGGLAENYRGRALPTFNRKCDDDGAGVIWQSGPAAEVPVLIGEIEWALRHIFESHVCSGGVV